MWINEPWCKISDPPFACFKSREGHSPNAIGLHFTAGRNSEVWFRDPKSQASSHFLIQLDGAVLQGVDLDNRAFCLGVAELEESEGSLEKLLPDRWAINIEIENWGPLTREGNIYKTNQGTLYRGAEPEHRQLKYRSTGKTLDYYWEPYNEAQVNATATLCAYLVRQYGINLNRIVGHEDVATPVSRKCDPGPMWDWDSFYNRLAGMLGYLLPADLYRYHNTEIIKL
jgi:N-acetyl-anhydromuramyl-L-alanine amidase AmpD